MAQDEMQISVRLGPEEIAIITKIMARMKPTDDDGKLRSITIPDAIREAIRVAGRR